MPLGAPDRNPPATRGGTDLIGPHVVICAPFKLQQSPMGEVVACVISEPARILAQSNLTGYNKSQIQQSEVFNFNL